jgi:putative membrane protein
MKLPRELHSVSARSGDNELCALLAAGALALIWSGWAPYDKQTWVMEVAPIFIALPILWWTARQFPLTPLLYRLVLLHAVVLMIGGHYTYARVPAGFWVQEALHLARNPYDRLGHLVQGFVPALVARELLLRRTPLQAGGWLFTIVCAVALAISACYEFVEWWTAVATGDAATDFLGTQGDPWDTQWDMFCALIGAVFAQLAFARVHDRALAALLATATPATASAAR